MPIYVYRCKLCNLKFEKKQGINDPPLEKCIDPDCGGRVERVIQPVAFTFKEKNWKGEAQPDGSRIYT
jgi:putative FmdB family regulatory protein